MKGESSQTGHRGGWKTTRTLPKLFARLPHTGPSLCSFLRAFVRFRSVRHVPLRELVVLCGVRIERPEAEK